MCGYVLCDNAKGQFQKSRFSRDDGKSGFFPRRHTTKEGLGVLESLSLILSCQTGSGMLICSGTIEDNFLIFG